ncbi:flagellar biosynthesis protein FlhB [Mesoterricola sediminis]|uniref:Flagellar biosynthetic protein FlhB n=1 Tax=Mesoterricola sediminis TaxID=2927980 RepID=A0AA48KBX5_9BACT|nr:flagellar biosynthesis protein FlhB [Mesoterricola sediminis]BDU76564.1 flagellar biosynthesis protein FlhB [Mesoterricola sediminis]
MADPSRTEKATPKRRQKARKEGSILRVQDLDATVMLWSNFFLLLALGASTMSGLSSVMAFILRKSGQPGLVAEGSLHALAVELLTMILKVLGPFLAANFLLALGNQLAQHGLEIHPELLVPKFGKLNPAAGFKKLFSPQSAVNLLKSVLKFTVVAVVAWLVVRPRIPAILATLNYPMSQALEFFRQTVFLLYRDIMLVMLALAGADYLYQRHEYEKGIRMTKQEVKDEQKDAEGNPEIKGRQRSLLLSSAMRRILAKVPKASVVITNPTHFAVALQYEPGSSAPVLVAKGVDHLAFKIRERAKESGVPIVENPPLARAIYHNVDLDRPIPAELYQAVAQVLAYVYRLRGAA